MVYLAYQKEFKYVSELENVEEISNKKKREKLTWVRAWAIVQRQSNTVSDCGAKIARFPRIPSMHHSRAFSLGTRNFSIKFDFFLLVVWKQRNLERIGAEYWRLNMGCLPFDQKTRLVDRCGKWKASKPEWEFPYGICCSIYSSKRSNPKGLGLVRKSEWGAQFPFENSVWVIGYFGPPFKGCLPFTKKIRKFRLECKWEG